MTASKSFSCSHNYKDLTGSVFYTQPRRGAVTTKLKLNRKVPCQISSIRMQSLSCCMQCKLQLASEMSDSPLQLYSMLVCSLFVAAVVAVVVPLILWRLQRSRSKLYMCDREVKTAVNHHYIYTNSLQGCTSSGLWR